MRRRVLGVGLLFGGLVCASAHAHLGHVVMRAERYLKLDAEPEGVRLVVSLTLGPAETQRVAAAADANSDGSVSDAEADAYMAEWGEGLRTDLPVEVDGVVVDVVWGEAYFDPVGPIRPVRGAVEMVARVSLEPGRHAVSLRDRMRIEAFDRTDVKFEAQPGAQVIASGVGDPTERARDLAYTAQSAPDRLTMVVEVAGMPQETKIALGVGGAAVVVSLAAWLGLFRRRRLG